MLRKIILIIISGVLTGISFNSVLFSWLVWISFIPALYVISKSSLKQTILTGFLFGIIYYALAIFWVSEVTLFGLILLLIYLALYPLGFFLGVRFLLRKPAKLISIPALWVVLEFVKENIWCGFSWANLGYSQFNNLYLIQPADLLGVKFISFFILAWNVFLWGVIFRRKFLLRKTVFVLLLISFSIGYSFFRLERLTPQGYIDISLVQPNISQELKWQARSVSFIKLRLRDLSKETDKDSLVIFPEAAWPEVISSQNRNVLCQFVQMLERDVLMGAIKEEENKFYNSVVLLDSQGEEKNSYSKIKLVPFGEYIPLRKYLKFIDVINLVGDMSRGKELTEFSYKDKKFSVLICFEDIFPSFVRNFSKGKDFLVNITNDGWFGGRPQSIQHFSIMVFRAIENRIPIARCANTGISGWVTAAGEFEKLESAVGDVFFSDMRKFTLGVDNRRSVYNRYGEIFSYICVIILLVIFLINKRRKNEGRVRNCPNIYS